MVVGAVGCRNKSWWGDGRNRSLISLDESSGKQEERNEDSLVATAFYTLHHE